MNKNTPPKAPKSPPDQDKKAPDPSRNEWGMSAKVASMWPFMVGTTKH